MQQHEESKSNLVSRKQDIYGVWTWGGVGFPKFSGPLCHLDEDGVCEGDAFFRRNLQVDVISSDVNTKA